METLQDAQVVRPTEPLDCDWFKQCFSDLLESLGKMALKITDTNAQVFVDIVWVPDFNIPMGVIMRTMKYHTEGDVERAKWFFEKCCMRIYGESKVDEVLENWKTNDILNKRIHILEQAITAHKLGLYYLSIPVFCAQIEGYITTDIAKRRVKQKQIAEVFGDIEKFHLFSKLLMDFTKEILMAGFDVEIGSESPLSRNAILHGNDLQYGTKENSLKLLMLFNLIQTLHGVASSETESE